MKTLIEYLDECGALISEVNDIGAPSAGHPTILRMLQVLGDAGLANQAARDLAAGKQPDRNTGLKPGQVVVDVGTGAADDLNYTGPNRWQDMTRLDWAFYFAHDLRAKQAIIFAEKPQYIDPVTGANYNNKDAEFRDVATGAYPDLTGYSGPLADFV